LTIKKKLIEDKKYHIQFAVIYKDPDENTNNIRTFNYSIHCTNDLNIFYMYLDGDFITKLLILKELKNALNVNNKSLCCFDGVKEDLINRLTDSFFYYKTQIATNTRSDQFTLPYSLKYLPLYLNTFFKKPLMRKIKNKIHPNIIANFINLIFTMPLNITMKSLYPKFIRIDDITEETTSNLKNFNYNIGYNHKFLPFIIKPKVCPLSLDSIDLKMAFLYDDGYYINIIITCGINHLFIYEVILLYLTLEFWF
jgi:hypothetical protein